MEIYRKASFCSTQNIHAHFLLSKNLAFIMCLFRSIYYYYHLLYGNETADILAKKGTKIKTKPVNTLPFESAKLIKTKFKKQYTVWISTKSKDQSWGNIVKTPGLI